MSYSPASPETRTWPFFALAVGLTWLLQLPALLAFLGVIPGPFERYVAGLGLSAFAPLLAGTFLARRQPGGVGGLYRRFAARGVGPLWYAVALFGPGLLLVAGVAVFNLLGGDGGTYLYAPTNAQQITGMIVFSLGEEVGWRGYALPRLLQRYRPLQASLLLGLLWGAWHIPMFIMQGFSPGVMVLMILVFLPAGSICFTWLFAHTRGSLLLAVLMHMGAHLNNSAQPLPGRLTPALLHTAGYVLAALLLVLVDKRVFTQGATPELMSAS
jgi:membrane protease YdiL (CAAX protease family)